MTDGERDRLAERFQTHRPTCGRSPTGCSARSATPTTPSSRPGCTWTASPSGIDNLGGWLTTIVARVSLDLLHARTRPTRAALGVHLPDPILSPHDGVDPERQALLAEGIGLAPLVVLDTLAPVERLALVLHDSFAVPFDQIAAVLGRSPATRLLASRVRHRVQGRRWCPTRIWPASAVVEAFLATARRRLRWAAGGAAP